MTKEMNKWERIEAALHSDDVDRVPISLWKHYHLQDRAPGRLAEVSLALHRKFDTDLLKLTPSGLYPIQDWGATIRFGRDDDTAPVAVQPTVAQADEWERLPPLDVTRGALRRELEMIHWVAKGLDGRAPFMMTIFSPLTIAYKLRGDALIADLRHSPRQLHAGLAVIRDVVLDFVAACLEAGAPGFFFATQLASTDRLNASEYEEFGVAYDRPILEWLRGKSRVTMLHVCGQNLMFELVADYPVDVINWADRDSGPSLAEARQITDKALAGGLSLQTLLNDGKEEVVAEVRDAIAQADERGLIIAPACVIRGPSPDANLQAARRALEPTA